MAEQNLSNIANVAGSYNGTAATMQSDAFATLMLSALTVAKTADKDIWITGELTYTVTVSNGETSDFTGPVFTDTLDPALVALVADSVTVNGTPTAHTYNADSGLLTVNLPTIAASGGNAIVVFRVQKK